MFSKKYRLHYLLFIFTRIFFTWLLIYCLREVPICEAFNQINRYEGDSFRVGYGLFEYVQI